jgi:hypothetical protein
VDGPAGQPAPWTLSGRVKELERELAEDRDRARALERRLAGAAAACDAARARHERHVEILEERVRRIGMVVDEEVADGLAELEAGATAGAIETRLRRVRELVAAEVSSLLVESLLTSAASAPGGRPASNGASWAGAGAVPRTTPRERCDGRR